MLLTPLRKGPFGVEELNKRYRTRGGVVPIILTENARGFANGETGLLYPDGSTSFGVRKTQLPRFEEAYALSVHKSQGSEYERVWLVLPPGSERFGRQMLYTAITRAKKEMRIFADTNALAACIRGDHKRLSLIHPHRSLDDAQHRDRS